MGAWGIAPFQSDNALNEFGGIYKVRSLERTIKESFKHTAWDCYAGYEITALLTDTYDSPEFLVTKEEMYKLLKEISKSNPDEDLFNEAQLTLMTACAIPIDRRQNLLKTSTAKLKKEMSSCIESGNPDELLKYMRIVYSKACKIIDNNFANPILINEKLINNAMRSWDEVNGIEMAKNYANNELNVVDYDKDENIYTVLKSNGTEINCREHYLKQLILLGKVKRPSDIRLMTLLQNYFSNDNNTKASVQIQAGVLQVKCVKKCYTGCNITAYIIQDISGATKKVTSEALKSAIKNNKVNCVNLKLTSDNRLVSIKNK